MPSACPHPDSCRAGHLESLSAERHSGQRNWLRTLALAAIVTVCSVSSATQALAQQAAGFRFSDLDLRDPHVFVSFIGCLDITDTGIGGFSVNGELQTQIQNDGDGDGLLDASYLVEFLPLDQTQSSNLIDFGSSDCSAPLASTSCAPVQTSAVAGDASLQSTGSSCLSALAGSTRPYVPALTEPPLPCFVSPTGTLQLDLGGVPVQLRDVQVAAQFVGNPATGLQTGLLRGFISETDANATLLPPDLPLIGGQPLSSVLPGGTGNCAAHSDKDVHNGVVGWWFYLNFTAPRVVVNGPGDALFGNGFEP